MEKLELLSIIACYGYCKSITRPAVAAFDPFAAVVALVAVPRLEHFAAFFEVRPDNSDSPNASKPPHYR